MRKIFAETLSAMADKDPRIVLLTADLGFMALEPFSQKHPDRFFNVGVAEQNMIGVATGLAEAGLIPYVYSIVNFATMRPLEFIRNGPVAHQLPVRIVSVGGGVEYGHNGNTHYGLEDIGILRTQPGLTIVCPGDSQQAQQALYKIHNLPQPCYLRLAKDDHLVVPGLDGRFELTQVQLLNEGDDILIIALGTAAIEGITAAEKLKEDGILATLVLLSSFNPGPDVETLALLRRFKNVITLEKHYNVGGLGSWVAELASDHGLGIQVTRLGFHRHPGARTGNEAWMLASQGLDPDSIRKTAIQRLT